MKRPALLALILLFGFTSLCLCAFIAEAVLTSGKF